MRPSADEEMMSIHPICRVCYDKRYPGREAQTMPQDSRVLEFCCDCGSLTTHGIYFRADPKDVCYPAAWDQ